MLPVSEFGQVLRGCVIVGFRAIEQDAQLADDLAGRFEGLTATGVPFGEYEARLRCGEQSLSHRFVVDQSEQLELIPRFTGIRQEGRGPTLVIRMDSAKDMTATFWVQLIGVYNGFRTSVAFSRSGESRIQAPPSGSYIVVVQSTEGYQCVKEVDLVEFTRNWQLHRATCTLDVDRFAHVVSDKDKLNHRQGEWYRAMEKEKDTFFRQLQNAGDKR
jgi:hypothetical protein